MFLKKYVCSSKNTFDFNLVSIFTAMIDLNKYFSLLPWHWRNLRAVLRTLSNTATCKNSKQLSAVNYFLKELNLSRGFQYPSRSYPKPNVKKVQVFHNVHVLIYSSTLLYLTNRRGPFQMFHRIAALKKYVKYTVQNMRWNMELMDGMISSAKWYPFLSQAFCLLLTLSWWRSLPYKNQFIDLQSKSTNWFLYERGLRDERVKGSCFGDYSKMTISK